MQVTMLKCKIHRATVTQADLNYEGSISLCPDLIEAAGLFLHERIDVYNCNNGARFSTYVIEGRRREVCLNGAAARHVQPGDPVILAAYCSVPAAEARKHVPAVVFVDGRNRPQEKRLENSRHNRRGKDRQARQSAAPLL